MASDDVITPRSTPAARPTTEDVQVQLLVKVRDELAQMVYSDAERSRGESSPAYRNGWNDAMREAMKAVAARIGVELMCLRCDWHVKSRSTQLAQLAQRYVNCPRCQRGDMLTTREVVL